MNTDSCSSVGITIPILCPTRWTVRADSLCSVYNPHEHTWHEATGEGRVTETKARILGVQRQMKKFSFMFGVYFG